MSGREMTLFGMYLPLLTKGALVCMSRWDMPVHPGGVIICRRSCAEPGCCFFAAHFLPRFSRTMLLSAFIGGAMWPHAEENAACVRHDRQAKMHSDLTMIIFC